MGKIGPRLIDVLCTAWSTAILTKSSFAREYADEIAQAASMALITTRDEESGFGRTWRITPKGLHLIFQSETTVIVERPNAPAEPLTEEAKAGLLRYLKVNLP